MKKWNMLLMLLCIILGACESKQVYDNVQQNAQRECQKMPPTAFQECIEESSESFESYSRRRKELLDKAE